MLRIPKLIKTYLTDTQKNKSNEMSPGEKNGGLFPLYIFRETISRAKHSINLFFSIEET